MCKINQKRVLAWDHKNKIMSHVSDYDIKLRLCFPTIMKENSLYILISCSDPTSQLLSLRLQIVLKKSTSTTIFSKILKPTMRKHKKPTYKICQHINTTGNMLKWTQTLTTTQEQPTTFLAFPSESILHNCKMKIQSNHMRYQITDFDILPTIMESKLIGNSNVNARLAMVNINLESTYDVAIQSITIKISLIASNNKKPPFAT